MKRLRLLFYVLVAVLWLPLLGLVVYALRNVEQEEEGRYQTVAERLFDDVHHRGGDLVAIGVDAGGCPANRFPLCRVGGRNSRSRKHGCHGDARRGSETSHTTHSRSIAFHQLFLLQ